MADVAQAGELTVEGFALALRCETLAAQIHETHAHDDGAEGSRASSGGTGEHLPLTGPIPRRYGELTSLFRRHARTLG